MSNPEDVQPKTKENVQPDVEMFQGKPRYLKLSDGQVFDRAYQPKPNKRLPGRLKIVSGSSQG